MVTSFPSRTVTNTAVSVGVGNTAVLAANNSRVGAIFINDSDTVIYLALGATAALNSGIRLNASGGSYTMDLQHLYTGAISAISSGATKNLCVVDIRQNQAI